MSKTLDKKAIWWGCGLFAGAVIYVALGYLADFTIPCLFHLLTGWYCPGCGITRMIFAMLELNFLQAFRYNPLLFILIPFAIVLYVEYLIARKRGKIPLHQKIPSCVWVTLIIIALGYGVLRNLPWFNFLAPTMM